MSFVHKENVNFIIIVLPDDGKHGEHLETLK